MKLRRPRRRVPIAGSWDRGSQKPAVEKKETSPAAWAFMFFVAIPLLGLLWCVGLGDDTTSTTASEPTLSTTVRFTGTQIVVINRDYFDWRDCKIAINSGIFGGGWTTPVARIAAGDTVRGGIATITRRGGERFNPATHTVETITLICQTPRGLALWEGEW